MNNEYYEKEWMLKREAKRLSKECDKKHTTVLK